MMAKLAASLFICQVSRRTFTTTCPLSIHRWIAPVYRNFLITKKKMERQGIAHIFKRSQYIDWNYDAELYAFGKRLNEDFDASILRESLIDDSYILQEKEAQKAIDMTSAADIRSNNSLIPVGRDLTEKFIGNYLRTVLTLLPEEGIRDITTYLLTPEVLSEIGFALGLRDLILTKEHPPSINTMSHCILAIIAALKMSSGVDRAQRFVLDFIISHLLSKDIGNIWKITEPMDMLTDILHKNRKGAPEPRLIFESGRNTLEAVYQVGVYSEKIFLGSGYGESIETAVHEAAHDAIRHLFCITDAMAPFPFRHQVDQLTLKKGSNPTVDEWGARNVVHL